MIVVPKAADAHGRAHLRTPVAIALVASALLSGAAAGSPPTTPSTRPSAPLVPVAGALFGAWVDLDGEWTNEADAFKEVETFEASIHRRLAINHHWYAWTDRFPTRLEPWDVANGRIPLITWEPWTGDLFDIAEGRYDELIERRARDLAAFGSPVFFRWGHEMNGDWYPWGGANNRDTSLSPGDLYVAAYRRIHRIFAEHGATNAVWVWSPNWHSFPDRDWNHWSRYYPGDAYVDWVGIDGYNWGSSPSAPHPDWRSFAHIVQPIYDAYAGRKPIMVAETSSVEEGGSKAEWITEMHRDLLTRYPQIAALVWFHAPGLFYDSSPGAALAFRSLALDPYFSPPLLDR